MTVVDDTGQLLTDSDSDAAMALTAAQSEHKRSVEASYQTRIQQLMSAVVGLGNVRTEVDVVLNFAEIESTTEEFDRGGVGPRTRSESLQLERDNALTATLVCLAVLATNRPLARHLQRRLPPTVLEQKMRQM